MESTNQQPASKPEQKPFDSANIVPKPSREGKSFGSAQDKPASKPRITNAFTTTLGVAILLATLFTAWTPSSLFASNFQEQLNLILTPQAGPNTVISTPQPQLRIGIVAGHTGNDSGAVCLDENGEVDITEADVNLEIANLVQKNLRHRVIKWTCSTSSIRA